MDEPRPLIRQLLLTALLLAGGPAPPASGTPRAESQPPLVVLAPGTISGEPGRHALAGLDLRLHAPGEAVEIHATRDSWADPVVTTWRSPDGNRVLPSSPDVTALARLVTVTVRHDDGSLRARRTYAACPAARAQAPVAAGAPEASPWPRACPDNVFSLGAVIGVQSGWANGLDVTPRLRLAPGRYTVTSRLARAWAEALGTTPALTAARTRVTVRRSATPARAAGETAALGALPPGHLRIVDGRRLRFTTTVWAPGPSAVSASGTIRTVQLQTSAGRVLATRTVTPGRLRGQSPVDLTVAGAEWVPTPDAGRLPVGWGSTHSSRGWLLDGQRNGVYRVALVPGTPAAPTGPPAYRVFELYGPEDDRRLRVLPAGQVSDRRGDHK